MNEGTIDQDICYVRQVGTQIQCFKGGNGIFTLQWECGEYQAAKQLKFYTMAYLIEDKSIWDGIYIKNSGVQNLSYLFMLKTVKRLGEERCLERYAPPDKERPDIFFSLQEAGIVRLYKGSCGILRCIGRYRKSEFLAMRKQYTQCYAILGKNAVGLYLRNNHLVFLTKKKIKEDRKNVA